MPIPKDVATSHMTKLSMLMAIICTSVIFAASLHDVRAQSAGVNATLSSLQVPDGFKLERFADVSQHGMPRMMAFDKQGRLYVTLANTGRVLQLDTAGNSTVIAQGLNAPNGIDLLQEDLLIAEQTGIVRLNRRNDGWSAPVPFIHNLPAGGHGLKSVKVSPAGDIFVNVGSSCNVCIEDNPMRATLLRFTQDGRPAGALLTVGRHTQSAIWAHGLRNSQGLAWHPQTGEMFATNEGADNRSAVKNGQINDDIPPEHLNRIEAGKHYGWPYCWGNPAQPDKLFQDPNVTSDSNMCAVSQAPALMLPAHSTPIGISFLHNSKFPEDYQQDAIVALHGSWNRKQPSGYALLRVQFRNQQPVAAVPFVSGWLRGSVAWGRPVDVIVGPDGWLYVSDDATGWIYRIRSQ